MKNLFTGKNNKPLMGRVATLLMLGLIAANSLFATTPSFARSTTNTTNIQNSFKTFCVFYYYDGKDIATQAIDSKNCKGRSAENCPFSGTVVELQSAQIRATGVERLQCPACGAARKATIRGELVIYPPHTPLRIARANKGPLWIRQGATWTKR